MGVVDHGNRYELRNRYMLTGQLIMQTAFHIGGGKVTLSSSDNPVVLTPQGQPFIPGSSFKGALRSRVEKLVPALPPEAALSTCGLIDLSDEECERLKDSSSTFCSTQWRKKIKSSMREKEREKEFLEQARAHLCHTCQLFGSPYAASRINVMDLFLVNSEWTNIIQRRDGVAIDRDSEKARDRLKYDFEVVPASTMFELQIILENATPQDLQLISIGLSEFMEGFGVIGGKRSQGLGLCRLENLQVAVLELEHVEAQVRSKRLRNYLLKREFSAYLAGEDFLNKHINMLFSVT